jgi:uncharacterized DUF497 family protein
MEIEFDPAKDEINRDKHGASLAFAADVLSDPRRIDLVDTRIEYSEDRTVTYGKVMGRVWVCVFTRRGNAYRPISVRKANDRETKRYHNTAR